MCLDQSRHGLAENPQAPDTDPSSSQTPGFDPSIDRPPADIQNPGCFVDPEQSLLLQCENRVHDASPCTRPECFLKTVEQTRRVVAPPSPDIEVAAGWRQRLLSVNSVGCHR
jgi:hypothetical protein